MFRLGLARGFLGGFVLLLFLHLELNKVETTRTAERGSSLSAAHTVPPADGTRAASAADDTGALARILHSSPPTPASCF